MALGSLETVEERVFSLGLNVLTFGAYSTFGNAYRFWEGYQSGGVGGVLDAFNEGFNPIYGLAVGGINTAEAFESGDARALGRAGSGLSMDLGQLAAAVAAAAGGGGRVTGTR